MRVIVILVIAVTLHVTFGQPLLVKPAAARNYGFTPNPIGSDSKGLRGDVPKHALPNQNAAGKLDIPNGLGGEKVVNPMYQDKPKPGQSFKKTGQDLLNANQPNSLNLNYNKPNNPLDNSVNNKHHGVQGMNTNQIENQPNFPVNSNLVQGNSKHNLDKSFRNNAFKVPVNRNVEHARQVTERPAVNLQDGLQPKIQERPHVPIETFNKPVRNDPVPVDLFDTNNQNVENGGLTILKKNVKGDTNTDTGGKLPGSIKVIDGEVEKTKIEKEAIDADEDEEEDDEEDEEYDGEDEDLPDNNQRRVNSPVVRGEERPVDLGNTIPKVREDMDNHVINDNAFQQGNLAQRYPDNVNGIPNMESVLQTDQNKQGSLKVVWDWSDFAVNFEQYIMPEQKIRRAPHATTGEPWPLPQYYVSKPDKVYRIDKATFKFKLSKIKCDVIEKAIERYKVYVLEDTVEDMYDNFQHAQGTMFEDPSQKYETPLYLQAPVVSLAFIKIRKPCARYPTTKMDETYDLFVKRTGIHIMANEVWGALRGLETFSQLVFKGTNQMLYIRDTVINDYPRFIHRGVMIDSSRHFMFKETTFDVLEGMAQNKMNVLHWHLVDDQSFPFYSSAYPDLSGKGAFHPTFVYMPEDIADIIEFARLRGIRVEPEFDTPGHTYSWGLSRPDILTQCYQGERPVEGYLGPMDPSKNETFRFLKTFFKDVMSTFKDEFLHLGGDEVPMTCWQSNPEVMKFLAKLEGRKPENPASDPYYYSYDIRKVLEYYVTRLIGDLKSIGSKRNNGVRFVFWQEIMNNNVQLPNDTIIHVWQGGMEDVQRATSLGLNVIFSTCWYLDQIEYGVKWSKYYQCDPADMTYGYTIDESKVLGGEACLWAEYIENENAMVLLWPRASAAAERLWSHKDVKDLDAAAARLQEHRCRMLSRGLGVGQISGPDYCLKRGKRRWQFNETSTNCTQCGSYNENSRVEVEKIKVEFEQKGGHISDCSQAVIQAGSQLTIALLIIIVIAVGITLKVTKQKINQVRMCRNKTILLVFVTLILVYFMCYTSIWMQAMQFKGSFEKRISSNVQKGM